MRIFLAPPFGVREFIFLEFRSQHANQLYGSQKKRTIRSTQADPPTLLANKSKLADYLIAGY